jgi:Papain-like cysteine protease AvrRpt2
MLVEYKIKFEKDGLTITQCVEPSGASPQVDQGAQVTSNYLSVNDPVMQNSLPASYEESRTITGGGPNDLPRGRGPNDLPRGRGPNDLPRGRGGLPVESKFPIQREGKNSGWCWAAVGVSIAKYFSPKSDWTQCKLAEKVLRRADCCADPVPPGCNQAQKLEDALTAVNALRQPLTQSAPFKQIRAEIDSGLPLCAGLEWHDKLGDKAGGHFVVICGYSVSAAGDQWLEVADPFYGNSTVPYDQFRTEYRHSGIWQETFLVHPLA